jgi:hypothetical protein
MSLIRATFVIWCSLLAALSGMLFLARHDANSRLDVLKFDSCKLPCWLDIVPGKTTLNEAESVIKTAFKGNTDFTAPEDFYFVIQDKMLSTIRIVLHKEPNPETLNGFEIQLSKSNISLTDLIDQFGTPSSIVPLGMGGGTFPALLYAEQQVAIVIDEPEALINNCLSKFLKRRILFLQFGNLSGRWGLNPPQRWRGFTCYHWKSYPEDY